MTEFKVSGGFLKHILVVDDEEGIRDALVEILERQDYSVASARNGQHALEVLKSSETLPELIILDMQMPVMDGWSFIIHLSKETKTSIIPVLIISGSGLDDPAIPDHYK